MKLDHETQECLGSSRAEGRCINLDQSVLGEKVASMQGSQRALNHPSSSPDPFPDRLQCLDLSIVSNDTCSSVFPGRVTENMLCAGGEAGKDACQVNQLKVVTHR